MSTAESAESVSRIKRKLVFSNEEKKKQSAAPLWSADDDISLLKGMIDYEVQKQSNPYDDMGKFLEFVKTSISFDFMRKQVTDRLWRLRNKYIVTCKFEASHPHHAYMIKLCKMVKAWGHAEVSADDVDGEKSENDEEENVGVDDVDGGKSSKVVKNKKRRGNVSSSDDQNVVVNDVDGGKRSKGVKHKKKGKVVISKGQNVQEDNVDSGKGSKVVKHKKKRKVVIIDGQNVDNDAVVVDEVDGGKTAQTVKDQNKGEVVIGNGQNVTDSQNLVVDDGGGKWSKVVKNKKKRKAVIGDGQNVEEDNVVEDDVQTAKKNGKKRVKVVGNENVPKEVMKKDLNDFTSMYPHLTKAIELEALSMMPLHLKKNFVMDIINSMGREKANGLEEKWADLHLMEIELHAKKLDMMNKQIKLILEAMHT